MVLNSVAQDYSLGEFFPGDRITFPTLRHIVNQLTPDGYALEFGVAEGTSLNIIAQQMPVVGFDSFDGLPEDWGPYPRGSRACAAPEPPDNVRLVKGLYADTLPLFDFSSVDPIKLVHIDCDLYSSTVTVLEHVGPHLKPGCFVVFDEWLGNDWYVDHEQKAWREYVDRHPMSWTAVGHDSEAWGLCLTGVLDA